MRIFLLFLLVAGFFSWAFSVFYIENIYDKPIFQSEIADFSFQPISSGTSSMSAGVKPDFYEVSGTLTFESPRTAFYFQFPRFSLTPHPDDVVIEWILDGKTTTKSLDTEELDMIRYQDMLSSELLVTTLRSDVSFRIQSKYPLDTAAIHLISSDTATPRKRLAFSLFSQTNADSMIISRKEWGANEEIRYKDSAYWKPHFDKLKLLPLIPPTEEQRIYNESYAEKKSYLQEKYPLTQKPITFLRYEGGRPLVWPIMKTKQVDRIIIHHTAENLDTLSDDATMIRAIYQYHTNKWGDIGYNYIIGQRGKIYEGRAGGDYVVGGHVPGNNEGTVSIAVMGNFEVIHLNRDQRVGLESAITYVARKYGITLSSSVTGFYPCSSTQCGERGSYEQISRGLAGHRDLKPTACPGRNIYSEIPDIITKLDRVYLPVDNPIVGPIEFPEPEATPIKSILTSISTTIQKEKPLSGLTPDIGSLLRFPKIPSPLRSSLISGPDIRVRLSYPDTKNSIQLESATPKEGFLRIGKRKIRLKPTDILSIDILPSGMLQATIGKKKYQSSLLALEGDILRILSWDRVPLWDSARKYNDNLFRGRISMRVESGKLLITNELPLEQYLKGMGEVSEGDAKSLPEKAKVMIVAGRSYGLYYLNPNLPEKKRKFPGKPYDISDNPDESQVYKGYSYEQRSPTYTDLVDQTTREVVWYDEKPIKVPYSSTPGGRTLSYKEYCEIGNPGKINCEDISYLQSVDDPGSAGKPKNGHGYGISGDGAKYFALQGWNYTKIIQYYLKGVEIKKK